MLLVFYADNYTSNGFGANAPKKGIVLIPFVKNKHSTKVKMRCCYKYKPIDEPKNKDFKAASKTGVKKLLIFKRK